MEYYYLGPETVHRICANCANSANSANCDLSEDTLNRIETAINPCLDQFHQPLADDQLQSWKENHDYSHY